MMDDNCPQCDGPPIELGSLGNVAHYRCRNCGWMYYVEHDEQEPEPPWGFDEA